MENGKSNRGFTLIELLVVIAIISLLVSILLPSLNRAKELAKRVVCLSNVRNIGTSIHLYANENNSKLPPIFGSNQYENYWFYFHDGTGGFRNIGRLAGTGLIDPQSDIFICPTQKSDYFQNSHGDNNHPNCVPGPTGTLHPEDVSVVWTHARSYYRRSFDTAGDIIETINDLGPLAWMADVFSHPGHVIESHADGVNVWYGDGHAEYNIISNIDELWDNRTSIDYNDPEYYSEYWESFD